MAAVDAAVVRQLNERFGAVIVYLLGQGLVVRDRGFVPAVGIVGHLVRGAGMHRGLAGDHGTHTARGTIRQVAPEPTTVEPWLAEAIGGLGEHREVGAHHHPVP